MIFSFKVITDNFSPIFLTDNETARDHLSRLHEDLGDYNCIIKKYSALSFHFEPALTSKINDCP